MRDPRELVCHWDERLRRYRLIWVPDAEAHFADERFQKTDEHPADREPNDFGKCDFED